MCFLQWVCFFNTTQVVVRSFQVPHETLLGFPRESVLGTQKPHPFGLCCPKPLCRVLLLNDPSEMPAVVVLNHGLGIPQTIQGCESDGEENLSAGSLQLQG